MNKVKSLDFDGYNPNKRLTDAKVYRLKLLEAQKKQQMKKKTNYQAIETGTKDTKKDRKQKGKKHDGHGVAMDEKSSFGQCAFNMANILMVRLVALY